MGLQQTGVDSQNAFGNLIDAINAIDAVMYYLCKWLWGLQSLEAFPSFASRNPTGFTESPTVSVNGTVGMEYQMYPNLIMRQIFDI